MTNAGGVIVACAVVSHSKNATTLVCMLALASCAFVCASLTAYLLIQFPPTHCQSDDSVVRQLLSCYLRQKYSLG